MNEKLKKLAAHVLGGVENEKDNAERLLRMLCEKKGLDYDELLSKLSDQINRKGYEFHYKKAGISKDLAIQIVARYGFSEDCEWDVSSNSHFKIIFWKTTPAQKEIFDRAVEQVKLLYKNGRKEMNEKHKEEKKLFLDAFLNKHDLFFYGKKTEEEEKPFKMPTDADIEKMMKIQRMQSEMDGEVRLSLELGTG